MKIISTIFLIYLQVYEIPLTRKTQEMEDARTAALAQIVNEINEETLAHSNSRTEIPLVNDEMSNHGSKELLLTPKPLSTEVRICSKSGIKSVCVSDGNHSKNLCRLIVNSRTIN